MSSDSSEVTRCEITAKQEKSFQEPALVSDHFLTTKEVIFTSEKRREDLQELSRRPKSIIAPTEQATGKAGKASMAAFSRPKMCSGPRR
jgi:hypothetical protein